MSPITSFSPLEIQLEEPYQHKVGGLGSDTTNEQVENLLIQHPLFQLYLCSVEMSWAILIIYFQTL